MYRLENTPQHGQAEERLQQLDTLTCWADRRINVHRASDETFRRFLGLIVDKSQAEQLVERLRDQTDLDIAEILATAPLREQESAALELVLTDHSHAFSLWITETSSPRQRSRFSIARFSDNDPPSVQHFEF